MRNTCGCLARFTPFVLAFRFLPSFTIIVLPRAGLPLFSFFVLQARPLSDNLPFIGFNVPALPFSVLLYLANCSLRSIKVMKARFLLKIGVGCVLRIRSIWYYSRFSNSRCDSQGHFSFSWNQTASQPILRRCWYQGLGACFITHL